ncbi:hypothetical protein NLJ89_g7188 [Agrocybe chaxingu]|uniref:O-methyltransferase domain-containing protein n=1 Tax=Agrocybe chaxingu TaxID=84603 RepID=A0A9W8MVP1_9AGAR|nr:hypothetical protein NLJ89_g7188 [Agrocybe chaxingu]
MGAQVSSVLRHLTAYIKTPRVLPSSKVPDVEPVPRTELPRIPANSETTMLAALIADATKIVEAHYARSSHPGVPSLNDTDEHPLDQDLNSELRTAIQIIEGACAQLSATVARPEHTIVNIFLQKVMAFVEPACLGIAITFKIPDVLREKPDGMHISEIGQRTGLEERKVGRILRLLASRHVFTEVSENVFANNRLSIQLLSDNPLSSMGSYFTEEGQKSTSLLPGVLGDKLWGHSYLATHTAFNKWSLYDGSFFAFINAPQGLKFKARFDMGMIGWGKACQAHNIVYQFPWKELPDGASVCDLGGGVGNISLQLAKAYPTLKLILQDLPETIQRAKTEVWPEKCPEAIRQKRIEFKTIDFFKESPVAGCNVYFLKNIIHDWPDHDCVTILANIRKVMEPYSQILIHEQCAFQQAPLPMLPNYGAGRIRQYNLDLHMMAMLNSEERKLADFVRLGELAGLKFEKLWDLGETAVVELRLP